MTIPIIGALFPPLRRKHGHLICWTLTSQTNIQHLYNLINTACVGMCTLWTEPYDRQLSKLKVCAILGRQKAEKQSIREWTVLLLRVKGCRHHSGELPPPNAAAWASQPTKDVFIELTWKKIFSLLYRSMKGPVPDKVNSNKSAMLTLNQSKKIFCLKTDNSGCFIEEAWDCLS